MAKTSIILRRFDITIDFEDYTQGALAVLKEVRSEWEPENIRMKLLSGGLVNKLICCHLASDEDKHDGVMLRVFTSNDMGAAINRDDEIAMMTLAGAIKVAPPVYGLFNNGVIYKYARGRRCIWADLRDDTFIRLATEKLARLHQTNPDLYDIVDDKGNVYAVNKSNKLLSVVRTYLDKIPESLQDREKNIRYQKELPKRAVLEKELDFVEAWLEKKSVPLVLAHNDFYCNNAVYDDKTQVWLLDYEFLGYNYEPFDVAVAHMDVEYFCHLFFDENVFCKKDDLDADDATFRKWARGYLQGKRNIMGLKDDITEQEVDDYAKLLWQFKAIVHLIVNVINYAVIETLDSLNCVSVGYGGYFSRKHLLD